MIFAVLLNKYITVVDDIRGTNSINNFAIGMEKPTKLTTLCRSKLTTPKRGYF